MTPQEQTSEDLKVFFQKFGTLRIVDSGESTPDALFGKLNAVVVAMLQEVSSFVRINSERRCMATNPCLAMFATRQGRPEQAVSPQRHRRLYKLPVSCVVKRTARVNTTSSCRPAKLIATRQFLRHGHKAQMLQLVFRTKIQQSTYMITVIPATRSQEIHA